MLNAYGSTSSLTNTAPRVAAHIDAAKTNGGGVTYDLEQRAVAWMLPRVPRWVHPDHLTAASLPISLGVVLAGLGAVAHPALLHLASLLVALQWLTDTLDGALGRVRCTGAVRWGFYADHMLDFLFLASVFGSYWKLAPASWMLYVAFIIVGAIMVSSYLVVGACGRFQIAHYGVGPTEGRIVAVMINTLVWWCGAWILSWVLPAIIGLGIIALVFTARRESRALSALDEAAREASRRELN